MTIVAGDQYGLDTHTYHVPGHTARERAIPHPSPILVAPPPEPSLLTGVHLERDTHAHPDPGEWLELRVWAEMFHDAQLHRIATENRIGISAGGVPRKNVGQVDPRVFAAYLMLLEQVEASAKRSLLLTYRAVVPKPIRDWQKATKGVGDHTLARLLGHIGHPSEGRTVSQLLQYCGHGAPKLPWSKGMTQEEAKFNGNPMAKMLVHLIAEAVVIKGAGGHLRQVYDDARAVEHVHTKECRRCGPSGSPALVGSPWNPGHAHAHAMRMIGKTMLKELYKASGGGQAEVVTHSAPALSRTISGDDHLGNDTQEALVVP